MTVDLRHGDNLKVLPTLPDCSVDSIVTDPPYGLAFMGRTWDQSVPVDIWAECLRVLRPGGHLLAFGGTRTWHRQAVAIEDAGFEIRDSITWLYGSGFPKSLDVSKAIDKAAGATREVVGTAKAGASSLQRVSRVEHGYRENLTDVTPGSLDITAPATDAAQQWQGWGTALKPASEPIVVARKPLAGTVAATVLAHGTGALNINACRVEGDVPSVPRGAFSGSNNNMHMGGRNGTMSEPHARGRWPANVVLTHGEDCADVCVPGCPVAELDTQSGTSTTGRRSERSRGAVVEGTTWGTNDHRSREYPGDAGGASRFFPVFKYQAKAPMSERPKIDGQGWPTVKPLALMRWLVRLVTPPDGLVLDPFAGTGATLQACELEGFDSLGVELDDLAYQLACQRLDLDVRDVVGHEGSIAQTGAA